MPSGFDLSRLATVQLVSPTPFTADGREVVPQVLAEHSRRMAAAGIRVFIPAGGTGEFHSLSVDEVIQCVEATRNAVSPECLVVAPVGLGLSHAITLGRRALEVGSEALLLMPPVHPYLSDEGFRDYFQAIAEAVPLPILAYKKADVPGDRLLLDLARSGRLVGVKYAVNNIDAFARFVTGAPSSLGIYCGTAERFAPYFALAGSQGFTSGAANLFPRLALALDRHLRLREFDQAMQVQRNLRPIEDFRALDADSFNISAVKAGLAQQGMDFGPPRPPQRRMTSEQLQELSKILDTLQVAEQECKA